jgi:hypothetical protein
MDLKFDKRMLRRSRIAETSDEVADYYASLPDSTWNAVAIGAGGKAGRPLLPTYGPPNLDVSRTTCSVHCWVEAPGEVVLEVEVAAPEDPDVRYFPTLVAEHSPAQIEIGAAGIAAGERARFRLYLPAQVPPGEQLRLAISGNGLPLYQLDLVLDDLIAARSKEHRPGG